jgi:hypothetical protein
MDGVDDREQVLHERHHRLLDAPAGLEAVVARPTDAVPVVERGPGPLPRMRRNQTLPGVVALERRWPPLCL